MGVEEEDEYAADRYEEVQGDRNRKKEDGGEVGDGRSL